ncbi:hypothetical protein I79_009756 [Cricetulus griseus]|uniref:Uncharacterized protein n=1 Tax=Cricetulus griseus TaxID=10029 RepID=G3HGL8_CRIGR|nr:hypothetical protein I79_009756 [Cricetulus griseus]
MLGLMTSPIIIKQTSSKNWWKWMQRPTTKCYMDLRESCGREEGKIVESQRGKAHHKKTHIVK